MQHCIDSGRKVTTKLCSLLPAKSYCQQGSSAERFSPTQNHSVINSFFTCFANSTDRREFSYIYCGDIVHILSPFQFQTDETGHYRAVMMRRHACPSGITRLIGSVSATAMRQWSRSRQSALHPRLSHSSTSQNKIVTGANEL